MKPGGESTTVLVVDGSERLRSSLSAGAPREGILLRYATGDDVMDAVARNPHLVLLDVSADERRGLARCRAIRAATDVPIVVVADGPRSFDPVLALDAGADDVIEQSGRLRELLARLRAVLRRSGVTAGDPLLDAAALQVGNVWLDPGSHEVRISGIPCHLPRKQFELLRLLLANPGRTLPRQMLIQQVWGPDYVGDTKTLDVHVKRLRARIERDPSTPRWITTVRGVGYRYERDREAADSC